MTFGSLCICENEEALCVAAHAGSEVVHSVHDCESIRVTFFCLERVDGFKLAVKQRLIASRKVDEGVCDAALQLAHLRTETGCALTNRVKTFGNIAELVITNAVDVACSAKVLRNR